MISDKLKATEKKGGITIFFAICLLGICALLLGLFESARTAGARLYFTQAANSAIESLFSQYHRDLWESYRLLGLEHYSDKQLSDEMRNFMEPYFEVKDWYPLSLEESPSIAEKVKLTDNEGEIYEAQVLEYMKYGFLEELWNIATAEKVLTDISEAFKLKELKNIYEDHSREASRLEKAIEKLNEKLLQQKEDYENALEAVMNLNGSTLIRRLKDLKKDLKAVAPLVEDYEKKADALAKKLEASKREYDEGKGSLSDSVKDEMEANISQYSAYVDKDGERRLEIESMRERAAVNIEFVDRVIEVAEEVLEYIEEWEPEDEDDELDEEALWRPVERLLRSYDLLMLNISFGVADKEKEGFLESVGELIKGDLLKLVLPSDAEISKEKLPLSDIPSKTCFSGHDGSRLGLIDRLMVTEYALKEFNYYGRGVYGEKDEPKGGGHLELEYIFSGKDNDYDNLANTVMTLLAIREGMNLIYLFSNSEMKGEARALAAVITGVMGFPPLISVMTFFILGTWALGQAIYDLRTLLSGGRVPIIHNRESWTLDLDGLLKLGSNKSLGNPGPANSSEGLCYKEWMRVLIFKDMGTRSDYRSMDMIQMNLRERQEDFLLNRCVSSLEMSTKAYAGHVMFTTSLGKRYSISTDTYYSYVNNEER